MKTKIMVLLLRWSLHPQNGAEIGDLFILYLQNNRGENAAVLVVVQVKTMHRLFQSKLLLVTSAHALSGNIPPL